MYRGVQPDADAGSVRIAARQFGITLGFGVERDGLGHLITQSDAINLTQGLVRAMRGIVLSAFLPIVQAETAMNGQTILEGQGSNPGQAPGRAVAVAIGVRGTAFGAAGSAVAELGLRPLNRKAVTNPIAPELPHRIEAICTGSGRGEC